jgi:hypothetical protein
MPALRIALLSTAAGAVEPCGCVKDMLGGVDHAGAYLRKAGDAPLLVLGAGPMLFMDPSSKPDRVQQDRWKAEAMSSSLRELGLRAWAPGLNDFALGAAELQRITQGGPALLAANLSGANAGAQRTAMFTVGGVRVGVVGISRPAHGDKTVEGMIVADPRQELEKAALELHGQGASLRIALIALPRGEALRLIEAVPNFQLAVLGKASDQGDANDTPVPPTQVGKTLVVEGPNHLQALYVVDWFVKDKRFEFVNGDSSGEAKAELDRRISELEERIRAAEKSASVSKADLEARRKDLAAVRAELLPRQAGGSARESGHGPERQASARRVLRARQRAQSRRVQGQAPPARARGLERLFGTEGMRLVSPGGARVLEHDPPRGRLRDARQAEQAVQPRLRRLPRHGLRRARWLDGHVRRRAQERAVRDVPRTRFASRQESLRQESDRRNAVTDAVRPQVPSSAARQAGLERGRGLDEDPR